jgi:hypothetical protein
MNKQDLLNLKNEIELAKQDVSKLEGKQQYLMTQLKDQFGCDTIADAEKKSAKLEKQISKMSDQIEIATTELEEKYELSNEGND